MNLIIDIGNTRSKIGLFDGDQLQEKWVRKKLTIPALSRFCEKNNVQHVALSSTAEVPEEVEAYLKKTFKYLRLSHKTPLPIVNLYRTPKTLGRDRLAGVVGALQQFPGKNCLVVDAGTCITYDFLDADTNYHGGGISPGIAMRLKAMNAFTAKLPLVKQKKEPVLLGFSTHSSLQSGGQWGAVMEVEGFIRRYRADFGKINVVLTGGDADFFANHLKTKIFVNSNLVLCGLNKILTYNVQTQE